MSTLSISSPGVQINEVDQSLIARPLGATDVLAIGFADSGPTNNFIDVSSVTEYESIFGTPTTAAERYLYYTAKQILLSSPANLKIVRLPYGPNMGDSPVNSYSVLAYPITTGDGNNYDQTQASSDSSTYILGEPTTMVLSEDDYFNLLANQITWNDVPGQPITDFSTLGNAGLIVVNKIKSTINSFFEGQYLAIIDNSNVNPSTAFNAVQNIYTVTGVDNTNMQTITTVPSGRLNFTLTQDANSVGNSISKQFEQLPTNLSFSSSKYKDSLLFVNFSLNASQYNNDTISLNYTINETYVGSLFYKRTQNSSTGGTPKSLFLDTVVNTSSPNIRVFTNPYISNSSGWINDDGTINKSVRIGDGAQNAYPNGVYTSFTDSNVKDLGSITDKLDLVLEKLDDSRDVMNIDLVVEAGLATINSLAQYKVNDVGDSTQPYIFDETYNISLDGLNGTTPDLPPSGPAYNYWYDVANRFVTNVENAKTYLLVLDPLRSIFVQGFNAKISNQNGYNFTNSIWWPLNNLFSGAKSSYITTYANWIQTYDKYSDSNVWVPPSGYAAAVMAKTAQLTFPWIAPAGFNRGGLNNVTDIAINPNQKQRDLLYKSSLNPIVYYTSDGFVIYGQKTLLDQPSAFDRINVRRLFLTLEKETQALLKYFVFEPNTFATRNRLKGALVPTFDQAKLNDGLYDYLLVCDETNNTPDVIDNNELRISIYIQPVKAAEFILADFIATRTGVNFSELVG